MREIQASEAKTHLPQLLDDVEGAETIVIVRNGRAAPGSCPKRVCGKPRSTERPRT
jgi:hypothetical protein